MPSAPASTTWRISASTAAPDVHTANLSASWRSSTPGTMGWTPSRCQGHGLFVIGRAAVIRGGHVPGFGLHPFSRVTRQGMKVEGGGGLDVCLQDALHVEQCVPGLPGVLGRHAIGRDHQAEVAHVRIIGGEEYTDVPGETGKDHGGDLEIPQEEVQSGGIKAGVLRLQHNVIVPLGPQLLGQWWSPNPIVETVGEQLGDIRLPPPEMIIHRDGRDAGVFGTPFQRCDLRCHRQGVGEQDLAAVELQIVEDVDEEPRDSGVIRSIAVQILLRSQHRHLTPAAGSLIPSPPADEEGLISRQRPAVRDGRCIDSSGSL